jgi:hypothetical protein
MLPFKPYPGFHWVLLALCIIFALMRPEAAMVSFIWFAFFYHFILNRISIGLSGKKFTLPGRHTKDEELHLVGLLLLIPYSALLIYSVYGLHAFAVYVNQFLDTLNT